MVLHSKLSNLKELKKSEVLDGFIIIDFAFDHTNLEKEDAIQIELDQSIRTPHISSVTQSLSHTPSHTIVVQSGSVPKRTVSELLLIEHDQTPQLTLKRSPTPKHTISISPTHSMIIESQTNPTTLRTPPIMPSTIEKDLKPSDIFSRSQHTQSVVITTSQSSIPKFDEDASIDHVDVLDESERQTVHKNFIFKESGLFQVLVRVTDMVPVALYQPKSKLDANDGYFLPINQDSEGMLLDFGKTTLNPMITGTNLKATEHIVRDIIRFGPYMEKYLPTSDFQINNFEFDLDTAEYFSKLRDTDFKTIVGYIEDVDSVVSEFTIDESIPTTIPGLIDSHTPSGKSLVSSPQLSFVVSSSPTTPLSTVSIDHSKRKQKIQELGDILEHSVLTNVLNEGIQDIIIPISDSQLQEQDIHRMDDFILPIHDIEEHGTESLYYQRMSPTIKVADILATNPSSEDEKVTLKAADLNDALGADTTIAAKRFQSIRPFLIEPIKTNKALVVMLLAQMFILNRSLIDQPKAGLKFFSPLLQSYPFFIEQDAEYKFRDDLLSNYLKDPFSRNLLKLTQIKSHLLFENSSQPMFFTFNKPNKNQFTCFPRGESDLERKFFELKLEKSPFPNVSPIEDSLLNSLMMNHTRNMDFDNPANLFFKQYFYNLDLTIIAPGKLEGAFQFRLTPSLVPSDNSEFFYKFTEQDFTVNPKDIVIPDYQRRILQAETNSKQLLI